MSMVFLKCLKTNHVHIHGSEYSLLSIFSMNLHWTKVSLKIVVWNCWCFNVWSSMSGSHWWN